MALHWIKLLRRIASQEEVKALKVFHLSLFRSLRLRREDLEAKRHERIVVEGPYAEKMAGGESSQSST